MEVVYFSTITTRDPVRLGDFPFRVSVGIEALDRSSIQKIKHLTVSTGNLKTFRLVQLRPINRVVYPGSFGRQAPMESSSWHRLHA